MVGGAADYLGDLIKIFNQHNWHWAFFTFRQDTWDGMDYEIGIKLPGAAYWQAIERGETPQPKREDNAVWNVLKRELKPQKGSKGTRKSIVPFCGSRFY